MYIELSAVKSCMTSIHFSHGPFYNILLYEFAIHMLYSLVWFYVSIPFVDRGLNLSYWLLLYRYSLIISSCDITMTSEYFNCTRWQTAYFTEGVRNDFTNIAKSTIWWFNRLYHMRTVSEMSRHSQNDPWREQKKPNDPERSLSHVSRDADEYSVT